MASLKYMYQSTSWFDLLTQRYRRRLVDYIEQCLQIVTQCHLAAQKLQSTQPQKYSQDSIKGQTGLCRQRGHLGSLLKILSWNLCAFTEHSLKLRNTMVPKPQARRKYMLAHWVFCSVGTLENACCFHSLNISDEANWVWEKAMLGCSFYIKHMIPHKSVIQNLWFHVA